MATTTTTKRKAKTKTPRSVLERINLNAAGIDIGANFHWVALPEDRTETPVRQFGPFTSDLHRMADWLIEHGIETVVMESTGVYWIPVFQILEQRGLEVKLVNARHVKNLPGRKSDISDCQWLQQLHTFGLLSGSFRPKDEVCVLSQLPAPARQLGQGLRQPHPTNAEGVNRNEPSSASRALATLPATPGWPSCGRSWPGNAIR